MKKYIIYAIGEIALVVIGILIALQINNWNEGRKEQSQIKVYLNGLIEALNDDIGFLEYTLVGNTFRSECLKCLLTLSTGQEPEAFPKLNYEINEGYVHNRPGIQWTDIWSGPIPKNYNREFTEECFYRTTFGNIIVVNQSTLEEFKNTGLFSYIGNEGLKKMINDYYANMNWHFSDWREANYRGEIDKWEYFLRDNYRINTTDISHIKDPIALIRDHIDLQLEMEALAMDASGRANSAGNIISSAKELIMAIESELLKM